MPEQKDYREKFLQEVGMKLAESYEKSDLQRIIAIVTLSLDRYDISERNTEVGFVDDSAEQILKMYAGTLLTEGKSPKTVTGYIYFLKNFCRKVGKKFGEIGVYDIRLFLAEKQQTTSLRTCENYRAYLAAFFNWLQREELITGNPMDKIKPIKFVKEVNVSYTDVEIDAMRINCSNLRDRAILEVLLSSGIRVAELCALDIDDIDFSQKSILVKEGKGGKQRITYINDVCAVYLKKYISSRKDQCPCLFVTKYNKRITEQSTRKMFNTLSKKTGVKDIHPHKFRRTFATNMSRKGMDIKNIQKLLGHENINTTLIYISNSQDLLSAEYKKFA